MVDKNKPIAYHAQLSNLDFDTHKFVKDLTANGMPDKQAELLADHYASLLNDRLATKEDLTSLEERIMNKLTIRILSAQLVTIVTICTIIGFMLNL